MAHEKLNEKKKRRLQENQNCGNTDVMSLDTQTPFYTYT